MQDTSLAVRSDYVDERDMYKRSNFMISSKYKSTIFSNRIMAISLSRIQEAHESDDGYLTVTIKGRDIQKLFGTKGNSFFEQLSSTASQMTGHTIGWSNPETQSFEYIAAVTEAQYENGEFSISFHKKLKKYLTELSHSYTILNLKTMLNFKSTYSFRLFELLKSRCYNRKGTDQSNNLFRIEFDINELRLDLGVVNAELDSVKKVLNNKKGKPDYEKAVEVSPEKIYSRYKDFKARVLEVAVKEINALDTELHIDSYEPLKAGRGGKVYAIVFYVQVLDDKKGMKKQENSSDDNHEDILDDIRDLLDVKSRDARAIGEAANWDMDKITRNYEYSKTKDVEDIVGFMVKAVKEDWAANEKKPRRKTKAAQGANGFNNFKGRDYDYDELMQSVLKAAN